MYTNRKLALPETAVRNSGLYLDLDLLFYKIYFQRLTGRISIVKIKPILERPRPAPYVVLAGVYRVDFNISLIYISIRLLLLLFLVLFRSIQELGG